MSFILQEFGSLLAMGFELVGRKDQLLIDLFEEVVIRMGTEILHHVLLQDIIPASEEGASQLDCMIGNLGVVLFKQIYSLFQHLQLIQMVLNGLPFSSDLGLSIQQSKARI